MALDLRKVKRIHPRTLNRYLQELTLFHYLQITGGNKHREGYQYKFSNLSELSEKQSTIGQSLKKTLETIRKAYASPSVKEKTGQNGVSNPKNAATPAKKSRSVGQNGVSNAAALTPPAKNGRTTPNPKVYRTQQA